ncbi:hypothetical protein V8E55_007373 [Tylopilus felleus]
MLNLKPYTGPSTKLLLAFDIGTTCSSVSYCILVPHQVPESFIIFYRSKLIGVRFPAQRVARSDTKVPSVLYYDKSGALRAAGAEVLAQDIVEAALSEGWTRAEWWKLHLCPGRLTTDMVNDIPPLPFGKSSVDVLTDFIKYLFECCKSYIQECHPRLTWASVEDSIEYILTYPSGWDGQIYRRAIERAGLVPSTSEGQRRVRMLTEGEASLHSYVSQLFNAEAYNQVAPQGVVIINAGGGIIDLSMFSMTMASNSISCKEIAPAECQMQGSVFVTCRAKALIERKLEGWEHSGTEDVIQYTREFDRTTKLVIESNQKSTYVKIAGRRTHSSRHCILSGQLKLSGVEATGLFNDSVDAVINGFEQLKTHATIPITTVFLVGGLSTNHWFWSQLGSYFSARKMGIHRLHNHCNKVVAEGAVLYAATKRSVDAPSACAFTDFFNKVLSHKEPSLSTPCTTPLSCSRVISRDHLKVACATRSVVSALPVRVTNKEHSGGRTTLRGSLSRVFSR